MASLLGLMIENHDIWRMNEDAVIDQIANELSSGNLRVCPQTLHQSSAEFRVGTNLGPAPLAPSERRERVSIGPTNRR
jgi:hypothetical protein